MKPERCKGRPPVHRDAHLDACRRMRTAMKNAHARAACVRSARKGKARAGRPETAEDRLLRQLQCPSQAVRGQRNKLVAPVATWFDKYPGLPSHEEPETRRATEKKRKDSTATLSALMVWAPLPAPDEERSTRHVE